MTSETTLEQLQIQEVMARLDNLMFVSGHTADTTGEIQRDTSTLLKLYLEMLDRPEDQAIQIGERLVELLARIETQMQGQNAQLEQLDKRMRVLEDMLQQQGKQIERQTVLLEDLHQTLHPFREMLLAEA
ncbi:hypothetical protein KUV65_06675 [Maritalea mobilis]|uniref:hypothetical protein n=1 Tax=Maritalea mobilis TaxID=483324 RepID=UPI001C966728|nr:hypothetical protein [Maritalea mobilis]MBY6201038.1 hypothetical protein [Maritalea mobilis]